MLINCSPGSLHKEWSDYTDINWVLLSNFSKYANSHATAP